MLRYLLIPFLCVALCSCTSEDTTPVEQPVTENWYYPPNNSSEWTTTSIEEAGWNSAKLADLLAFLEDKNTKSFIILKNGNIVVEHYFDDFDESSIWYWASAGKTLTSTVTGIAQDEGYLTIETPVNNYLGNWTSLPQEKENLIQCKHLLTMTSGIDDSLGDDVSPENLHYLSDAGSRWAYHNVYVKTQDVVANATNQSWNTYFNQKLRNPIGMTGAWTNLNNLNVYWSNTRSMARFGLLIAANGNWNGTQIISESYLNEATNTSQNINDAYGYLWWLNGKNSYHLPQSQLEYSGSLIPEAPSDMFAALGKNDQKIYIVPSEKLVIIRMGESADGDNFALSDFDNLLWEKINAFME
ncbi:serine hydrolase domain-containing protein [Neptunitalea lumnitzerae]|nr:serine hydrolase [Neptunitalea sp. Y10]